MQLINGKIDVLSNRFALGIKTEHDSSVKRQITAGAEIDITINNMIDVLVNSLHSNKCMVFLYHDGVTLSTGVPYIKASCVYERLSQMKRSIPEGQDYQDLPISMFAFWNVIIIKNQIVSIPILDSIRTYDVGTYERLNRLGVKSVYVIGLYNYDNSPIGFLKLEYDSPTVLSMEELKFLKEKSYYISALLLESKITMVKKK